jgi:hypothetical protein
MAGKGDRWLFPGIRTKKSPFYGYVADPESNGGCLRDASSSVWCADAAHAAIAPVNDLFGTMIDTEIGWTEGNI